MRQLLDKQAGTIVYKPPARIQTMTHRGVNVTTLGQTGRNNCVQAANKDSDDDP